MAIRYGDQHGRGGSKRSRRLRYLLSVWQITAYRNYAVIVVNVVVFIRLADNRISRLSDC